MRWLLKHNFHLAGCDTDSILICKPDGAPFSEEERASLRNELNSHFPPTITWEDDGYFDSAVVVRSKNYVLKTPEGKMKIKGSGLVASQKEVALKEFINKLIDLMLTTETGYVELYTIYAKEIKNVQDIKRWCTRKTITEKVLFPQRTNEQKVLDAIKGKDYVEGDRAYFFYRPDESLCLVEDYAGVYDVTALLKKLHDTVKIFSTVLDIKQFPNYALKRNKDALDAL